MKKLYCYAFLSLHDQMLETENHFDMKGMNPKQTLKLPHFFYRAGKIIF